MRLFKISLAALSFVSFLGCSSLPEKHGLIQPEEKVISRVDDLSSRPDWAKESQPFKIKDGVVSNLGVTTVPGDSRVEAAYRIAANNAKGGIAGAIEQRLSFVFQNAEEGLGFDTTQARFIGAEASQLTATDIKVSNQYWEKVFAVDEHGVGKSFYRVYALVTIPESELKRAMSDAIRKQSGQGKLSKDFARKVNDHWEKFVEGGASRDSASD